MNQFKKINNRRTVAETEQYVTSSADRTAQSTAERTLTRFIMSTKVLSFADTDHGKKDYCKVHCLKKKSVTSPTSCMKGAASEASKTLSNISANLGESHFKHLSTKKPTVDEANHDSTNHPSVIDSDGHDVTKKSTAHHNVRSHSPVCSAPRFNFLLLLAVCIDVSCCTANVIGQCSGNTDTGINLAEFEPLSGTYQFACGAGFYVKSNQVTLSGADAAAKKATCCVAVWKTAPP